MVQRVASLFCFALALYLISLYNISISLPTNVQEDPKIFVFAAPRLKKQSAVVKPKTHESVVIEKPFNRDTPKTLRRSSTTNTRQETNAVRNNATTRLPPKLFHFLNNEEHTRSREAMWQLKPKTESISKATLSGNTKSLTKHLKGDTPSTTGNLTPPAWDQHSPSLASIAIPKESKANIDMSDEEASLNATGTVPTSAIHLLSNNSAYSSNPSAHSDTKKDENLYIPEDPLLSVPFYVYPEIWMIDDATYANVSIHEAIRTHKVFGSLPKHDDDYHFAVSSLHHPMRVTDPKKAKLFVVPIPFNMIAMATIYAKNHAGVCWKGMCNEQLLVYINEFLGSSSWFQRNQGADHIATLPYFHWDDPLLNVTQFRNIMNCHVVSFGDDPIPNHKDRLDMPSMYVGQGCKVQTKKIYDVALIATIKKGIKFRPRRDICDWMAPRPFNISMPVCGKGSQCPALAESRFGFHVRGDSASSSRLFDTLLSGTVPIFTQDKQYWGVPDWIDWDKLSYYANAKNQTEFMQSMQRIMSDRQGYEERHAHVARNRNLFDWWSGSPFDLYMYRVQTYLWPESRSNQTRYTAIKI
jgi:hypothetical protein